MKEQLKKVKEFHDIFLISTGARPTLISKDNYELRFRLMEEENEEYLEAAQAGNLVEIADALGDQLYILCGTILKHGLQHKIAEVFQEIHASNMSKLDADGKPIINGENGILDLNNPPGKILKSDKYFKPDIKKIIE